MQQRMLVWPVHLYVHDSSIPGSQSSATSTPPQRYSQHQHYIICRSHGEQTVVNNPLNLILIDNFDFMDEMGLLVVRVMLEQELSKWKWWFGQMDNNVKISINLIDFLKFISPLLTVSDLTKRVNCKILNCWGLVILTLW